jgi:transcriptional regulator with XRE-family HTH domain
MHADNSPTPNHRLRQERIRRNWRQQDLADQLETTVISIRRWERGSHQPSAYFREKLCTLFGKSAEELGLVETIEMPVAEKVGDTERPVAEKAGDKDESVLLPPASQKPQPEIRPRQPLSRIRHHRSLQLLGASLLGLALIVVVIVYSLHLPLLPFLPGSYTQTYTASPTPTPRPFGQSWPQTLNDPLMANDYDPAWLMTQNPPAAPGPTFGICDFSPISHTYQLQTFGANYCNYGSGTEHPWTDLVYSVDLSIRQGTWGGLVFRVHQGKHYYFYISTTGTYGLLVHQSINGGIDTNIVSGYSVAIHQGINQWNTLLVAARGPSFQLWINGQYVASAVNSIATTGTIGVGASYGDGSGMPFTEVWFRHAQVWRPTGSS